MNKQKSAMNKRLNDIVNEEVKKITVSIIKTNKMLDKFKSQIDELYGEITKNTEIFENQRTLKGKLSSIQRLLYATKMGIDRQKMKMYDIDENLIKEEVIRGM